MQRPWSNISSHSALGWTMNWKCQILNKRQSRMLYVLVFLVCSTQHCHRMGNGRCQLLYFLSLQVSKITPTGQQFLKFTSKESLLVVVTFFWTCTRMENWSKNWKNWEYGQSCWIILRKRRNFCEFIKTNVRDKHWGTPHLATTREDNQFVQKIWRSHRSSVVLQCQRWTKSWEYFWVQEQVPRNFPRTRCI